jgi:hypothetical protein
MSFSRKQRVMGYPDNPDIDHEWPSEAKLQQEFPKLFKQFWDDENIKTLNKS